MAVGLQQLVRPCRNTARMMVCNTSMTQHKLFVTFKPAACCAHAAGHSLSCLQKSSVGKRAGDSSAGASSDMQKSALGNGAGGGGTRGSGGVQRPLPPVKLPRAGPGATRQSAERLGGGGGGIDARPLSSEEQAQLRITNEVQETACRFQHRVGLFAADEQPRVPEGLLQSWARRRSASQSSHAMRSLLKFQRSRCIRCLCVYIIFAASRLTSNLHICALPKMQELDSYTIGDWSNAVVDEVSRDDTSLAAIMMRRLQAVANARGAARCRAPPD